MNTADPVRLSLGLGEPASGRAVVGRRQPPRGTHSCRQSKVSSGQHRFDLDVQPVGEPDEQGCGGGIRSKDVAPREQRASTSESRRDVREHSAPADAERVAIVVS